MSKSPKNPYSAVLGTGIANQVSPGAGVAIHRTTVAQPKGTKSGSKTASTNRTPTGRSVAGNW